MLCVILCKSFKVIKLVVGTKIGSFGNFFFMYDVFVCCLNGFKRKVQFYLDDSQGFNFILFRILFVNTFDK